MHAGKGREKETIAWEGLTGDVCVRGGGGDTFAVTLVSFVEGQTLVS